MRSRQLEELAEKLKRTPVKKGAASEPKQGKDAPATSAAAEAGTSAGRRVATIFRQVLADAE